MDQSVRSIGIGKLRPGSSGRIELIRVALDVVKNNPAFGVGPGGYIAELVRLHTTWAGWDLIPAHLTPLHAAAELGIVGGLVIVVILALFGLRATRTSVAAFAVFAPIAVFLLLEQRLCYIPADVALFAVWLAILDRLARETVRAEPAAANPRKSPGHDAI